MDIHIFLNHATNRRLLHLRCSRQAMKENKKISPNNNRPKFFRDKKFGLCQALSGIVINTHAKQVVNRHASSVWIGGTLDTISSIQRIE